ELKLEKLCTAMILTIFVAFPFMSIELIFDNMIKNADGTTSYANGIALVIYCLILSWVADGGAYFVGRAFGRHKLAPVISPKKTIEGAVGGFVIAMIISLASAYIYADVLNYAEAELNMVNVAIISAICILMSMFGDLSFSAIKRQYNVKDFGNLLPGHGGVLDRFDSVLFVCPTFYLLSFILPLVK
ncbi:MAG: phosphatidate cytidylyltransferase, partial [Acutalibacteraceae bacterium]